MWVVKFESLAGEPIALLMNYAVHSTVAGPDNTLITGDLAGAVERFVEKHYQDKAVALFTMGPAGDQNPKYNMSTPAQGKDKDPAINKSLAYAAMDALGTVIGAEVIQTGNRITRMASTARIAAAERTFSCTTQVPAAGPGAPSTPNAAPAPPPPAAMEIRLGLIMVNQIALTAVSGEVFTKIYSRLKKESPLTNTIMATIANDRIGYIAEDSAIDVVYRRAAIVRGCAEDGIVNGLVDMIGEHL